MLMLLLLLAVFAIAANELKETPALLTAQAGNGPFVPGKVCSDKGSAVNYLRDKHLLACDFIWPPYFEVDESKSGNERYSGLDMDLLDALAEVPGFTYTLKLPAPPKGNTTWTEWVMKEIEMCDVIMGYWAINQERHDSLLYIHGHLDTAEYLVTKAPMYRNKRLRCCVPRAIDGM